MRLQSIKLDRAFPETGTKKLEALLSDGWTIYEKESGERYTIYIMRSWNVEPENIGKASPDKQDNLTEETKAWKPEEGEQFWMVASTGDIVEQARTLNYKGVMAYGNYFKTEALATQARDAIKELLLNAKKL